jgi:hypothetical protein
VVGSIAANYLISGIVIWSPTSCSVRKSLVFLYKRFNGCIVRQIIENRLLAVSNVTYGNMASVLPRSNIKALR